MELPETRGSREAPAALPTFRDRPLVDGARLEPSPDREFNCIDTATDESLTRIGDGDADDAHRAEPFAGRYGPGAVNTFPGGHRMCAGPGWGGQ